MRCRSCRGPAVVEVRRHNAGFCGDCFLRHCREQVRKTIEQFEMFTTDDAVLVAISGGKDSLALWDILLDLGYQVDGLYLGLGIGEYSAESASYARNFAEERRVRLVEIDLPRDVGFDVRSGAEAARRAPCSACGLSKRHLFNKAAVDGGYAVMATGHNLDDEAAVLFGNTMRWATDYLGRQLPVLPASEGFVRKVKPLVRLGERETAAYCVVRGIDYIVEECPMAAGNKHLAYKEALNRIEEQSPGAKATFYFNFLEKVSPLFTPEAEAEHANLQPCQECGSPTPGDICAFCKLVDRASASEPGDDGVRGRSPRAIGRATS